jgi:thiamine biosynthesis lipoprotein
MNGPRAEGVTAGAGRRRALCWALGLGAWAATGSALAEERAAALHWHESASLALGTTIWLRVAHAEAELAERAVAAAMAAVMRVDAALSLFRPDSALSRLNHVGSLESPPPELRAALQLALHTARASGGTFDPTVQPLWSTWYEAHLAGRVPSARELAASRARAGWREIGVDPARIHLARPGMALTLNGIAQGFAADEARAVLRRHGVRHALLDTGEWMPMGRSENGDPWRLGVGRPGAAPAEFQTMAPVLATLRADGRAVACSADDKLTFTADRREHHIIDPRTSHSPRQLAMVVVVASSAAWADALSKPLFMGSAAQALAMARRFGVDVLAVEKGGRWRASAGMPLS